MGCIRPSMNPALMANLMAWAHKSVGSVSEKATSLFHKYVENILEEAIWDDVSWEHCNHTR